jgi:two-component system chemotaxis sensor kinase CheA
MNLDAAISTFLQESRELLADVEQAALRLEENPEDADAVNAMFRAAHTIKGSAGLFGMDDIVSFTHVVENVLDQVRGGSLRSSSALIAAVLSCCDHIGALVEHVAVAGSADAALRARGADLLAQLTGAASGSARAERAGAAAGLVATSGAWHISLRFGKDVLRNGMDPMSFLSYLARLGTLRVTTLLDALPRAVDMDPESCYLAFEVSLRPPSAIGVDAIESVFDFVRDDCALRILPPGAPLARYAELLRGLPEGPLRASEAIIGCGSLTPAEARRALGPEPDAAPPPPDAAPPPPDAAPPPPDAEVLPAAARSAAETEAVPGAGAAPAPAARPARDDRPERDKDRDRDHVQSRPPEAGKSHEAGKSVRVDADKLDRLIDLVGELVISGASTNLLARKAGDSALVESAEIMTRLVDEIRESALRLRMVQIGETFNRFRRVVRDVSQKLGKDINLVISGGETELDKAVVEKMTDPLTHMVRNAIDHGIEPAEVRLSRGKPAQGTVRLHAYHDSGSVVVEISDDGGGMNRKRLLARAIERGIVQKDQELTDEEILRLIFAPGFSTAEQVTDLSGRGVGMDVVRSNVEALRGTIEIESIEGQGSTLRVRIPLTLAIIDGFLVGVGGRPYVIALDTVVECIELPPEQQDLSNERRYLNLRGEVLPYVILKDLFGMRRTDGSPSRGNVVVVQSGQRKAGLVVDELAGEVQTVIKPMGKLFQHLRWISGSTVLGSGQVALILDVQALLQYTTRAELRHVNQRGDVRVAAR